MSLCPLCYIGCAFGLWDTKVYKKFDNMDRIQEENITLFFDEIGENSIFPSVLYKFPEL